MDPVLSDVYAVPVLLIPKLVENSRTVSGYGSGNSYGDGDGYGFLLPPPDDNFWLNTGDGYGEGYDDGLDTGDGGSRTKY